MKAKIKKKQAGFTLIELMIGMLIGLIAVAATISAFTSIIRSNSDYLKMVRLNQELNAVMTLMTRDLKRAGYSKTADGKTPNNDFMNAGDIVFSATRITFSYDVDGGTDGVIDSSPNEYFGFYHNVDRVTSRTAKTPLPGGTWQSLTDNTQVNITNLTFTDDVLSITTANLGEIRYIGISLTGQLVSDPTVTRTITERVRVRNDRP